MVYSWVCDLGSASGDLRSVCKRKGPMRGLSVRKPDGSWRLGWKNKGLKEGTSLKSLARDPIIRMWNREMTTKEGVILQIKRT